MNKVLLLVVFLIPFLFSSQHSQAQNEKAGELFEKSREAFMDERYVEAIDLLESSYEADPDFIMPVWVIPYFRSYAYEAEGIELRWHAVDKLSGDFERILRVSPLTPVPNFMNPPTDEIETRWGTLAKKYLAEGKPDSAILALKTGKERGGFSDYSLYLTRQMTGKFNRDAIFVNKGSNFHFNLLYLQLVENFRPDIINIAANDLMKKQDRAYYAEILEMDLDKIYDARSLPDKVTITDNKTGNVMEIELAGLEPARIAASYDLYVLSLLEQNAFKRDIYFSYLTAYSLDYNLYEYVEDLFLFKKITSSRDTFPSLLNEELMLEVITTLDSADAENPADLAIINNFRMIFYSQLLTLSTVQDTITSDLFYRIISNHISAKKYLYNSRLNWSFCEMQEAYYYEQIVDREKAMRIYEYLYRQGEESPFILLHLGLLYERFDQDRKAVELLSAYKEKDGSDIMVYHGLGMAYRDLFQSDKAVELLSEGIQLNPNDPYLYNARAYDYLLLKEWKKSIRDFETALSMSFAADAFAYNNMGYCYLKLGKLDKAEELVRKSIEMNDQNGVAIRNLGLIQLERGETEEGCKNLNLALEIGYPEGGTESGKQENMDIIRSYMEKYCR